MATQIDSFEYESDAAYVFQIRAARVSGSADVGLKDPIFTIDDRRARHIVHHYRKQTGPPDDKNYDAYTCKIIYTRKADFDAVREGDVAVPGNIQGTALPVLAGGQWVVGKKQPERATALVLRGS